MAWGASGGGSRLRGAGERDQAVAVALETQVALYAERFGHRDRNGGRGKIVCGQHRHAFVLAHEREHLLRRVDEADAAVDQRGLCLSPGEELAEALEGRVRLRVLRRDGLAAVLERDRQPGLRVAEAGMLGLVPR